MFAIDLNVPRHRGINRLLDLHLAGGSSPVRLSAGKDIRDPRSAPGSYVYCAKGKGFCMPPPASYVMPECRASIPAKLNREMVNGTRRTDILSATVAPCRNVHVTH